MDLFFEHLVRTLIFFLLTFSLCNANIQSVATIFTEKKIVATSHTTLQKISKIKCVDTCNKERQKGMCNLAGYNKATQTCYLSVDDPQSALDTPDEMSGIFFYEYGPTALTCATEEPLLEGTNPVPDSYFTASSEYSASFLAHFARMRTGVGFPWCPTTADKSVCFLQVKFHAMSTVIRVATQGGHNDWTPQYRLALSEDCITFNNLVDNTGNDTFQANADITTVVENQLPTPVTALCLRLFPLGWSVAYPKVKIEVYGCPVVL